MEQVETMSCQECKHFHENAVMYLDQCDFCFKDCKYEPKDEPTISKMEQVEDEPQTNADQHVQHVESVKDETGHWVRVGQWEWEHHTDTTHFGKTKGESITTNKVTDEPQTERSE